MLSFFILFTECWLQHSNGGVQEAGVDFFSIIWIKDTDSAFFSLLFGLLTTILLRKCLNFLKSIKKTRISAKNMYILEKRKIYSRSAVFYCVKEEKCADFMRENVCFRINQKLDTATCRSTLLHVDAGHNTSVIGAFGYRRGASQRPPQLTEDGLFLLFSL